MNESSIKLIVLDVDGVLTDGKLLIGCNGDEYKSFHVKDGMGISLAQYFGIKVALITGRESQAVTIRAKELKVEYVYQGVSNKELILDKLIDTFGIDLQNVFFMGDDINDLPVIQKVGFSAAPNDAVAIVKNNVDYICNSNGGSGAVREAIEHILEIQVGPNKVVDYYLNDNNKVFQ